MNAFSRVRGTEPPVERVRPRIRIRTSRKLLSPETTIHPLSFLFAKRKDVPLILLKGITYHTNFQYTELTQEYITSFLFSTRFGVKPREEKAFFRNVIQLIYFATKYDMRAYLITEKTRWVRRKPELLTVKERSSVEKS